MSQTQIDELQGIALFRYNDNLQTYIIHAEFDSHDTGFTHRHVDKARADLNEQLPTDYTEGFAAVTFTYQENRQPYAYVLTNYTKQ